MGEKKSVSQLCRLSFSAKNINEQILKIAETDPYQHQNVLTERGPFCHFWPVCVRVPLHNMIIIYIYYVFVRVNHLQKEYVPLIPGWDLFKNNKKQREKSFMIIHLNGEFWFSGFQVWESSLCDFLIYGTMCTYHKNYERDTIQLHELNFSFSFWWCLGP